MTKREVEACEAVVRIADALEKLLRMIEEERNGNDPREES